MVTEAAPQSENYKTNSRKCFRIRSLSPNRVLLSVTN